ncbi:hypothetical protein, partial [Photorhabdus bodei]|uniref:hypothetical protein n=1 Tax=Photorhabdus bodei TaxID=2029681 RepID=UPI003B75B84D
KMIKETGVNLNTVSYLLPSLVLNLKNQIQKKEKRKTRKSKYQFNENKNIKYDSENVETFRFTTIK